MGLLIPRLAVRGQHGSQLVFDSVLGLGLDDVLANHDHELGTMDRCKEESVKRNQEERIKCDDPKQKKGISPGSALTL